MFNVFQSILQNISINELTNCRDITETKDFLQQFGYALNFEELEAFKAFFNKPKQQSDNLNVLNLSELYNVAGGLKGLIVHGDGRIEFFNNPKASFSPTNIIFREQSSRMQALSELHIPNKYDDDLDKDDDFRFEMFGNKIFGFDPSGDKKVQLPIHAQSFNYNYVFFQASNEFHQAVEECTKQGEVQPQVPEVQHFTTESQFSINVVENVAKQKSLGRLNLSELYYDYDIANNQFLQLSLTNKDGMKYNLSFDLTEDQVQTPNELSITKNLELIVDGKAIKGKFSLDEDTSNVHCGESKDDFELERNHSLAQGCNPLSQSTPAPSSTHTGHRTLLGQEHNYNFLAIPTERTLHHFGGDFLVLQQHTGECRHPIEKTFYHADMHDMKGVLEILKNVQKMDVFKVLAGILNSDLTDEQKNQISDFIKSNYHVNKDGFEGLLEAQVKNLSREKAFETFANILSSNPTARQIHQIYDFVKENYNIFSATNFLNNYFTILSKVDRKDFSILNTQKKLYTSAIVVCLLASAIVAGLATNDALGDPLDL